MGCNCCKVDTPQVYEKCEKIKAFAEKYHKKRMSPCGQCTFGNPKFFPKKKHRKKKK